MFFDSEKAADDIEQAYGDDQGRRRPRQRPVPRRRVARLQGRPPGRRVHDQQPERAAHLRLRPVVLVILLRIFGLDGPASAGPYRVRLLREVLERGLHLVLADRAVETGRDLPGCVDAEEPRLARDVPRGDGRRRLVRCAGSCRCRRGRCSRGPCRCRRAAAGCRARGRSTATGSAPASRTTPRPACPCR